MLTDDQRDHHPDVDAEVRDIHALTPPPPQQQRDQHHNSTTHTNSDTASLGRIGEEEETNPLAIVPDTNYLVVSPRRRHSSMAAPGPSDNSSSGGSGSTLAVAAAAGGGVSSVHTVRKEEVESKIGAWQTAEIAKINNRFKREDVIINGWESEQVEKATATLKKIEGIDETFSRLRSLKKICVRSCPGLQYLPAGLGNLSSLKELFITDCTRLHSLPEKGLPASLSVLVISNSRLQPEEFSGRGSLA